jgi:phytoene dehydrogenase-like protein
MELTIPSVHDPSLAPHGHHVLTASVVYVPEKLASGG